MLTESDIKLADGRTLHLYDTGTPATGVDLAVIWHHGTPLIDDDTAYATPWGFDPVQIEAPVLLLHGRKDRVAPAAHAEWLADRLPTAELRMSPQDGHLSILNASPTALDWLCDPDRLR